MKDYAVLLRLLGVSFLWGFNFVSSAYLLKEFSPMFLSFSRLFFTAIFVVAIAVMSRRMKRPTAQEWWLLLISGVFGTLLNQYFYFTGLQYSTAGNASLIIALAPVATMILARIFLGETITMFKLSGAFIALFGVILIVTFGSKSFGISFGDIFLLMAMLTMSIGLLFVKRLSKSMPSFDITILGTVMGSLFMLPAAAIESVQGHMHISTQTSMWIILALTAVIGQGLAGFWWNQGIKAASASTVAMFMNIPPFIAIILAHFILGDPIRLLQIIGGILILLGVTLSNSRISPVRTRPTKSVHS